MNSLYSELVIPDKILFKYGLLFCIHLLLWHPSFGQVVDREKSLLRLGFNYGVGTEDIFPYKSKDYSYDIQFYKLQVMYSLYERRRWKIEMHVEPSLYRAKHVLLNEYYIQPRHGPDYLEQRLAMVQQKTIREYALGLGLLLSHKTLDRVHTYILGSVGPMINDTRTERLAEGFAFSDVFALGIYYSIENVYIDLRGSLRHVSNLKMQQPNSGYNSVNLEMGCTISL